MFLLKPWDSGTAWKNKDIYNGIQWNLSEKFNKIEVDRNPITQKELFLAILCIAKNVYFLKCSWITRGSYCFKPAFYTAYYMVNVSPCCDLKEVIAMPRLLKICVSKPLQAFPFELPHTKVFEHYFLPLSRPPSLPSFLPVRGLEVEFLDRVRKHTEIFSYPIIFPPISHSI